MTRSLAVAVLAAALAARADTPAKVGYQGRLLDATGAPAQGVAAISFSVYAVATAGNPLWSEPQTVALTDGFYAVVLGDVVPFGAGVFDGTERFLEVAVSGTPLTPRQRIDAVPYAFAATTAGAFSGTLAGDVTGAQGATQLAALQGTTLSAAHPSDGQVLKFDATASRWAPAADQVNPGTVTAVSVKAPLTVDNATTTPSLGLVASMASQFLRDDGAGGWKAGALTLTDLPAGVATLSTKAGGDLSGPLGAPTVAALQGIGVGAALPANGQVLKYSASAMQWVPAADAVNPGTVTSVSATAPLVISTATSTPAISLAPSSAHQVLRDDGTGGWKAGALGLADLPALSASGDVTGALGATVVNGLLGKPATGAGLAAGDVLVFDGTQWSPVGAGVRVVAGTGLSGGGVAALGGNVNVGLASTGVSAGTYTNATVVVDASGRLTSAAAGAAPVTSVAATGPLASSGGATPTLSLGTVGLANGGTGITSTPSGNQFLRGDGGGGWKAGAILAGDLPAPGGDLGGTFANAQIAALAGTALVVTSTPSPGQVLKVDALGHWAPGSVTGGTVTSVAAGNGLSGGTITSSGTLALAASGVTAGTYTNATVVVDATGRLTSASSGAAPVTSVFATGPLSSTGGATPTLSLGTVGIANGGTGITSGPTTTGQFLRANSAGNAWVVGTIGASDLPSLGSTFVAKSGDTMTGALALPLNGLAVGTSQLVVAAGNVGVGTASPGLSLDVSSRTDAVGLPQGSSAQRPSAPAAGALRYNSGASAVEYYNGSGWVTLAGVGTSAPAVPPLTASGGNTIAQANGYTIHTFTASGTFTPSGPGVVEVLVVAGGGSGGGSGGGGGGGVVYHPSFAVASQPYSVVVGAGGAGLSTWTTGNNGQSSSFGPITAVGGGGGGNYSNASSISGAGNNGGSGGGGGWSSTSSVAQGLATQGNSGGGTGYGNPGGVGNSGFSTYTSAGGGGAGQPGQFATSSNSGNGGAGIPSAITGTLLWYGGGGGGGAQGGGRVGGNGGLGGGGGGGSWSGSSNGTGDSSGLNPAQNGANGYGGAGGVNTGGGSGGMGISVLTTGPGGSGVVIVRYLNTSIFATGGSVATVGSTLIHTFTASGTFTPVRSGNVQVLVVGGGGGGGGAAGGGGGGVLTHPSFAVSPGPITVTVGAGGAGVQSYTQGNSGGSSAFGALTALGGGGGANYASGATTENGSNGGSGGGGGWNSSATVAGGAASQPAPTGGAGYASAGGAGNNGFSSYTSGGGGGALATGGSATGTSSGNGGNGFQSSITGTALYYGGGGGGGSQGSGKVSGNGGLGGGGGGGSWSSSSNGAGGTGGALPGEGGVVGYGGGGAPNTGGGGGGMGISVYSTGNGGSGVVVVSYPNTQ